MPLIRFDELSARVTRVLMGLGLSAPRAALGARLIAETDRDGVKTHGLARLPRFAEMVRLGRIDPTAEPSLVTAAGAIERWAGHRGPGNLAAYAMTERAVALAERYGIGAVALGDTTHWQRGGTYGWQAAEQGFALLCWTNTLPNLPPWGATTPALGNNPLVIAVPRTEGPVVLDIAMSQFSYGALTSYRQKGEFLPVPGGFDEQGVLTTDPAAIERTQRALPIGFWKGSGLAFVLDLLGAMLSGGHATHELGTDPLAEVGLSQLFIAISPRAVGSLEEMERVVAGAIAAVHAAEPAVAGEVARYPGEGTLKVRARSMERGVSVAEPTWDAFLALEAGVEPPLGT